VAKDALPLTVLVPEASADPIEVYDEYAALRMAVVGRMGVASLPQEDWDVPGVYLLLGIPDNEARWSVYVGKAPAGVRSRVLQHAKSKTSWVRGILVRRDTTFGFNSAQIGWLEGRLFDLFSAAAGAVLDNTVRPSDETLPPYDRQVLEAVVLPVTRLLRLLGYDPASPDEVMAGESMRREPRFFGVTLADLLAAGLMSPGEELISTNGAWPATARVLESGQVELGDQVFDTPSGSAAAVKGGAANGWDFWAIAGPTGLVTLATLRARLTAEAPQTPTPLGPGTVRQGP
jgi:hypothetical protein